MLWATLWTLLALWLTLLALAWRWARRPFGYWAARGVPFPTPEPFFGNVRPMLTLRESAAEGYRRLYQAHPGLRYVGIFQARQPTVLVRDPALARTLLARDFASFSSRGLPWDARRDPLTAHLLNMDGQPWRAMRSSLAPPFGPGRVRCMADEMAYCAKQLQDVLRKEVAASGGESCVAEARDLAARYTTDVIGRCAFGLQFDSLHDPQSRFRQMGRRMFRPSAGAIIRRFARLLLPHAIYSRLKFRSIPTEVSDFFCEVVRQGLDLREKSGTSGKDFLQQLLELRRKATITDKGEKETIELTEGVLAAQAVSFFLAGLETTACTVAFCLLELAHHPDMQQRARREVRAARADPLSYEALQDMRYLDALLAETLRKYPPSPNLVRVATQLYDLPPPHPSQDSSLPFVRLDPGVRVIVPVFALQRDEAYFPEPDDFRPERFLKGGEGGIAEGDSPARASQAYMPFGDGPRICIGQRFGVVQAKMALAAVLCEFSVSPSSPLTVYPPRLDPRAMVTAPRDGVWLTFTAAGTGDA